MKKILILLLVCFSSVCWAGSIERYVLVNSYNVSTNANNEYFPLCSLPAGEYKITVTTTTLDSTKPASFYIKAFNSEGVAGNTLYYQYPVYKTDLNPSVSNSSTFTLTESVNAKYCFKICYDYNAEFNNTIDIYKKNDLPDTDDDGIPNIEDTDIDGDGTLNGDDDDVDGDGTPNGEDDDVDGDGTFNGEDDDIDGDGTPNGSDNDADGDGIINDEDDDIDGDGLDNDVDNDDDGDGINDGQDNDDDGDGIVDSEDDDNIDNDDDVPAINALNETVDDFRLSFEDFKLDFTETFRFMNDYFESFESFWEQTNFSLLHIDQNTASLVQSADNIESVLFLMSAEQESQTEKLEEIKDVLDDQLSVQQNILLALNKLSNPSSETPELPSDGDVENPSTPDMSLDLESDWEVKDRELKKYEKDFPIIEHALRSRGGTLDYTFTVPLSKVHESMEDRIINFNQGIIGDVRASFRALICCCLFYFTLLQWFKAIKRITD